jgi:DNA polymerase (family 10)
VELVRSRFAERGLVLVNDDLLDGDRRLELPNEEALYGAADLEYIEPELREAEGEVDAAARHALPRLLVPADVRGVLHCHTVYSDGKSTIAEMIRGAQARGWSYVGISDHSAAAFYASGLSRERVLAQFEEIDELNAELTNFRILKGIEADILGDGRLDYDAELLAQFDFVIGSIHSRFGMDGPAMTERVLRAFDDPFITVLAHPTGRLLLSREAYAIDVDAVIEKAAEVGVAVELNADPRRMDLDWRYLIEAKRRGATVAIGPDAHSVNALDNVVIGVGMARKGWLEPSDLLNARDADGVLAFARSRRR